ncbi:MAG: Imm40 family immunity protein, partial [Phycisphaerae bacterium]
VVKFLEPLGIAILGGDVLQRKNDIVQYTYDNWYVANKDSGSDWQEYVALSCKTAQDYITKYPEGNRIIYYAAVMASLEIYQHLPDH